MGWWSLGNAKSDSYVQVTLRVPSGLYREIERVQKRWGMTVQDTILHILLDWFWGGDYE